jgi:HK97 family phage prohead protease
MGEADFSGWATKAGLKCSDGVTITNGAFQHMDKMQVPLVWQHMHNDPDNVLGHAVLEARPDGVYAYAYFNNTSKAQNAKEFVRHGDIKALSIYANNLTKKGQFVVHGQIREVSLVMAGANPEAVIDYVSVRHGQYTEDLEDEAVIHTGLEFETALLKHADSSDKNKTDEEKETVQDILDTLTDKQKDAVAITVGEAIEATAATLKDSGNEGGSDEAKQSAVSTDDNKSADGGITHQEGADLTMSRNVFDQNTAPQGGSKTTLTHSDIKEIITLAEDSGGSLKKGVEAYALKHGITSIETLFPDAKSLTNTPEFNKRRTEWVPGVLNAVRRSPFARVKTLMADITMDEARAKGYIKGNFKKEEWFGVSKRSTSPTTVYKKQKLDRDDMVDITDFDVVAWIRGEMRMMLEEELARAILIGDGRDVGSEDKIKDPAGASEGSGIRSILHEHEVYATTVNVNINDASSSYEEVVEAVLRARRHYKGTGLPTFYSTNQTVVEMLLAKDQMGRRLWNTRTELAAALMVADIVEVEVMEEEEDLLGIMVNLADYNIGADKGGEVNLFDDFDIDYNQYKYLIETRISGALVKLKSALILKKVASADVLVDPITDPTFVEATGVVTIPAQTGVVYKNGTTNATLTAGAQSALAAGASLKVVAVPASGYFFATNADDEWTFKRPSA